MAIQLGQCWQKAVDAVPLNDRYKSVADYPHRTDMSAALLCSRHNGVETHFAEQLGGRSNMMPNAVVERALGTKAQNRKFIVTL